MQPQGENCRRHAVLGRVRACAVISPIVTSEEQESTYKSESYTPRYHARDIAKFRVNYNCAFAFLCSRHAVC